MGDKTIAKIKRIIQEVGLTTCGLARLAGLNDSVVRNYLLGKGRDPKKTKAKIMAVLESDAFKEMKRLADIKKNFECDPPHTCFECPLPECNCSKPHSRGETEFLMAALAKDYIDKDTRSRQYDTSLPVCRKYNLLM